MKKPQAQTSLGLRMGKWFLMAEGVVLLYAYSIYYRLNRYQDYRYRYHKKHPWILNSGHKHKFDSVLYRVVYYKVGETIGGLETRQQDLEHWKRLENTENKS